MSTGLHRDLPDSELHEPRGASTADAGDTYIADGEGGGSWHPLSSSVIHQNVSGAGSLTHADLDGMEEALRKVAGSGVVSGGLLVLTGGVGFSVSAGTGVSTAKNPYKLVTWGQLNGTCQFGGNNFICVDEEGQLVIVQDLSDNPTLIKVGYVYTDPTIAMVLGYSIIQQKVSDYYSRVSQFLLRGLGSLVVSGLSVQEQASPNELKIRISPGSFYSQLDEISIGSEVTSFVKMFNSSAGWMPDMVNPPDEVVTTLWNDVTAIPDNALVEMTQDYWKKDLILVMPDGTAYLVYGQAEYASEDEARDAPFPTIPEPIAVGGSCFLAAVVCQKGQASIASALQDIRPILSRVFGFGSSAGGAVVSHGDLTGLSADDHLQYYNASRLSTWAASNVTATAVGKDTAQWNADRLQGSAISAAAPATNDVLQWNGSAWAPAASGGTFGLSPQTVVSADRSTTTSTLWQAKTTLTTPALTGTYRVGWSAVIDQSTNNQSVLARLQNTTDDETLGAERVWKVTGGGTVQSNSDVLFTASGVSYVTFSGAAKTFVIQYTATGGTAGIADARIELWRVS